MYGSTICACCGTEYERDAPPEEAWVEAVMMFGHVILEEPSDEVCDDCFQKIMAHISGTARWSMLHATEDPSARYLLTYKDREYLVDVEVTEGGFAGGLVEFPAVHIPPALNEADFRRNVVLAVARFAA